MNATADGHISTVHKNPKLGLNEGYRRVIQQQEKQKQCYIKYNRIHVAKKVTNKRKKRLKQKGGGYDKPVI